MFFPMSTDVEKRANNIDGFSVEMAKIVDGGVRFVGTMPVVVPRPVE